MLNIQRLTFISGRGTAFAIALPRGLGKAPYCGRIQHPLDVIAA